MRVLLAEEVLIISGGDDNCSGGTSSAGDQSSLGQDLTNAYEGAIAFAVYVMERLAPH